MKSFIKLSLHDAISSIYNSQDNASFVWKGHWPILVCNCHCMNESLMVNTLKASVQTRASQSGSLALSVFKWVSHKALGMTEIWELVGLNV